MINMDLYNEFLVRLAKENNMTLSEKIVTMQKYLDAIVNGKVKQYKGLIKKLGGYNDL